MPNGNKTDQEFLIPKWVMNGSDEIKSNFLSGFYDAEGSINYNKIPNNKVRWRIGLQQNKRMDRQERPSRKFIRFAFWLHNALLLVLFNTYFFKLS